MVEYGVPEMKVEYWEQGNYRNLVKGRLDEEFYEYPESGISNFMVIVMRGYVDLMGDNIPSNILNAQDKNGNTALHFLLSQEGHTDRKFRMLSILSKFDIDIDIPNNDGITPRMIIYDLIRDNPEYDYYLSGLYYYTSTDVPVDIIIEIMKYLNYADIETLCSTSFDFNTRFCKNGNSLIWRYLYSRDISTDSLVGLSNKMKEGISVKDKYIGIMEIYNKRLTGNVLVTMSKLMENGADKMVYEIYEENKRNLNITEQLTKMAIQYRYDYIVKELIDDSLKISSIPSNTKLNAYLNFAALYNNIDIISFLVTRGANSFNAALHEAVRRENIEAVKMLIDYGASDLDGSVVDAATNDQLEMLKYLISIGGGNLYGALEWATRSGRLRIVKFLTEKRVGNLKNTLQVAAAFNHVDIVDYILSIHKQDYLYAYNMAMSRNAYDVLIYLLNTYPKEIYILDNDVLNIMKEIEKTQDDIDRLKITRFKDRHAGAAEFYNDKLTKLKSILQLLIVNSNPSKYTKFKDYAEQTNTTPILNQILH